MSNLDKLDVKSRSNQNAPVDKKKEKKKDRAVLVHDEVHKKLKEESFYTGEEIRNIASKAIDYYFENRHK